MSDDIALNPFIEPDRLKQDVSIDITNITQGMVEQAGLYVHYASQTVKAKRQYERMKRALEILEARLGNEYRKSLVTTEDDGKGKPKTIRPTEPQIAAAISDDPRHRKMASRVIDAQEIYRLAEVAERSFEHRKDMLLQIARDAAREQGGPLRVVANQANSERRAELLKGLGKVAKAPESDGTPPWEEGTAA